MTRFSPLQVLIFICASLSCAFAYGQTCNDPEALCGQSEGISINTAEGVPNDLPASFCFSMPANAVFFSFETLDLVQFPDLEYADSTATLSLENLNCTVDTALGQGINLAVFSAPNLCDQSTFSDPIFCESQVQSTTSYTLESLAPSTTYYILVSGIEEAPPATGAAECDVQLSMAGPAVTYDLMADWFPESDENRDLKVLFVGETVVLTADENLTGFSWSGAALNGNEGDRVTANPEGVDTQEQYTVETTINGCDFTDQVLVPIRPAIIPFTAFTPNADGINDTWEIRNIVQWPNAQINVYSRWGSKVFQATNYSNDWGGGDLPAATYYYVIELNPIDFNLEPYTGSVTILR